VNVCVLGQVNDVGILDNVDVNIDVLILTSPLVDWRHAPSFGLSVNLLLYVLDDPRCVEWLFLMLLLHVGLVHTLPEVVQVLRGGVR
jgi:hypothetical protein